MGLITRRINICWIYIGCIALNVSTLLYWTAYHTNNIKDKEQGNLKVILFWNSFWGVKDWEIGYGNTSLMRLGCKFSNCYFTSNKSLLNSSDAVLFHIHELDEKIPPPKKQGQKWVFFMLESPAWSRNVMYATDNWKYKFDLTMTYRVDSDIHLPYGMIIPRKQSIQDTTSNFVSTGINHKWSDKINKKLVTVISSNCATASNREKYVKELQNYISVDHYGRCGNLNCQKVLWNDDANCLDMISAKYKFYLSFENSFCRDYITEKFYKVLPLDVVPIVRGSCDYHKIVPHKWYINVKDFDSPKTLAKYLLYLDSHHEQYMEYFKYRDIYILKTYYGLKNIPSWCELCEKLHQKRVENAATKLKDVSKWWGIHDCEK